MVVGRFGKPPCFRHQIIAAKNHLKTKMNRMLTEILKEKQREITRLRQDRYRVRGRMKVPQKRQFKGAISREGRVNLIAELKYASPSAGIIRPKVEPGSIARIYEKAGAAAISVITDKVFFKGDLNLLLKVKEATGLPLLRKDFILDEIQVEESHFHGADAILLIARILSEGRLKGLIALCRELKMEALIEVHDGEDLGKAAACGAEIIGINNRDLDTFRVDLATTRQLAPLAPDSSILVSESGISKAGDLEIMKKAGIQAVLVGTALMKSRDLESKTRNLVKAGTSYPADSG